MKQPTQTLARSASSRAVPSDSGSARRGWADEPPANATAGGENRPQRRWTFWRGFTTRLVAATLLVSLPAMILMAVLLTERASSSLTEAAQREAAGDASNLARRIEEWTDERREHMDSLSRSLRDSISTPGVTPALLSAACLSIINAYEDDYTVVEILNLDGSVYASSDPKAAVPGTGAAWFPKAAGGEPVMTSFIRRGSHIDWIVAAPMVGLSGRVEKIVVANMKPQVLSTLLAMEQEQHVETMAVDPQGLVLYNTEMGEPDVDTAMLNQGSLQSSVDNAAVQAARQQKEPGSARYLADDEHQVIGGYDAVERLDWVVVTQHHTSEVLAPVSAQRRLAMIVVGLSALVVIGGAIALSRWTTRPIRRLTSVTERAIDGDFSARVDPSGGAELVTLARGFNSMLDTCERLVTQAASAGAQVNAAAARLSASSDELAATTTQQSAAIIQATSTTEELARASVAIADTVDDVARQTAETRDNLEQAEADIMNSSERTLALASRVNEIDRLLDLINGIADRTNLLALNAAIEAARAGENGRGFAVVADEVRRLAESSKASAGDITSIVSAVQTETNATVMAMEKGAKQLQQGLTLLDVVTEANGQVRLTTQQQRSATAQVVETMEQLTDASRQVSATAQELSTAAGGLAVLAGSLEATDATSNQ